MRQRLDAAADDERDDLLTTYLQQEVAHILHLPTLPNVGVGFSDMGMDSLMSIELRRRLERGLEIHLPSTLVFEYPTVAALSDYMRDNHFKISAEITLPDPPPSFEPTRTSPDEATFEDESELGDWISEEFDKLLDGGW